MGVPMRVVVWGYRGGMGTLRIPYKLSTLSQFRYSFRLQFQLWEASSAVVIATKTPEIRV